MQRSVSYTAAFPNLLHFHMMNFQHTDWLFFRKPITAG